MISILLHFSRIFRKTQPSGNFLTLSNTLEQRHSAIARPEEREVTSLNSKRRRFEHFIYSNPYVVVVTSMALYVTIELFR